MKVWLCDSLSNLQGKHLGKIAIQGLFCRAPDFNLTNENEDNDNLPYKLTFRITMSLGPFRELKRMLKLKAHRRNLLAKESAQHDKKLDINMLTSFLT